MDERVCVCMLRSRLPLQNAALSKISAADGSLSVYAGASSVTSATAAGADTIPVFSVHTGSNAFVKSVLSVGSAMGGASTFKCVGGDEMGVLCMVAVL